MIKQQTLSLLILLLSLVIGLGQAHARSDDNEQPLHITADTAELNDKTGISIYRGNVRMVQGTTIITGEHRDRIHDRSQSQQDDFSRRACDLSRDG